MADAGWPGFLLSSRQSALYRLQRALGVKCSRDNQYNLQLRPTLDPTRAPPHPFEKEVILVAVDIHIGEFDDTPSYIEVGLSALDTRELSGAVPGYDAATFATQIKSATYVAHDTAIQFLPGLVGPSSLADWNLGCLRKEVAHWLHRTCHRVNSSSIVIPPDDFAANIVLVTYDQDEQLARLGLFGVHVDQHYGILDILDVRDIHQAFRERTSWTHYRDADAESSPPADFEQLVADLRINSPQEHNFSTTSPSAKRAHLVLQAALRCAVNDAEKNVLPLPAAVCDGGDFAGPFAYVRTDRERLAHMLSIRTTKTYDEIQEEVHRRLGAALSDNIADRPELPSDRQASNHTEGESSDAPSENSDKFWEAPESPSVVNTDENPIILPGEGSRAGSEEAADAGTATGTNGQAPSNNSALLRNGPPRWVERFPGNDSWHDDFAYTSDGFDSSLPSFTEDIKQKIHVYHVMTELWHLLLAMRSEGIVSPAGLAALRAVSTSTHVDVLLLLMNHFIDSSWLRILENASSRERSELIDLLELQIHTRLEVMDFYRSTRRPTSHDHQWYNDMLLELRSRATEAFPVRLSTTVPLPSSSQYARSGARLPPEVGTAIGQYKQHAGRFAYLLWAAVHPDSTPRSGGGITFSYGEDCKLEADFWGTDHYMDLATTLGTSNNEEGHEEMLEHLNGELEGRQRALEWYQSLPADHPEARGNAAHERRLHFMIGIKLQLLKALS